MLSADRNIASKSAGRDVAGPFVKNAFCGNFVVSEKRGLPVSRQLEISVHRSRTEALFDKQKLAWSVRKHLNGSAAAFRKTKNCDFEMFHIRNLARRPRLPNPLYLYRKMLSGFDEDRYAERSNCFIHYSRQVQAKNLRMPQIEESKYYWVS